jgi:hypothetical protein
MAPQPLSADKSRAVDKVGRNRDMYQSCLQMNSAVIFRAKGSIIELNYSNHMSMNVNQ